MTRTVVAWCRQCRHWTDASDIGQRCPALDCEHRMIRRVGFVCDGCSRLYRTQREVRACDCEELG